MSRICHINAKAIHPPTDLLDRVARRDCLEHELRHFLRRHESAHDDKPAPDQQQDDKADSRWHRKPEPGDDDWREQQRKGVYQEAAISHDLFYAQRLRIIRLSFWRIISN